MDNNYDKYILKGLLGSTSLLGFYLIVASLLGGFNFAVENFVQLWYWMIPLVVGFGVQIGLFFYVKDAMHAKAAGQAAASTGISATSMVACCAHHIADIAPFLGITALGLFLTKYQSTFLLIGVLSNILGITYMYTLIDTKLAKQKMKIIFYSLLGLSVIIVLASYWYSSSGPPTVSGNFVNSNTAAFQTITSGSTDPGNAQVDLTPKGVENGQLKVDFAINTHSVTLSDYDLAKITTLGYDGKKINPVSAPALQGHHNSGTLIFNVGQNLNKFKITIVGIPNVQERVFEWG
ncbi:MAG: hypothetical protein AABX32_06320 [Nanoarchaeota archaeon]